MSGQKIHPFDELFAQLTRLMSAPGYPVRHDWGEEADAEHTSVDRVVWILGPVGTGPLPYTLPDHDITGRQTCAFRVSLYAHSETGLFSLHASLAGNLDLLIGPPQGAPPSQDGTRAHRPGYQIGDSSPGPRGGNTTTRGFGMVVPVTLYTPLYSSMSPRRAIVRVVRRTLVEGSAPSDPELAAETG